MLKTDTAICIQAVDYSETSQVLTLFTRDSGKIKAIAKGCKRPKSPLAGPFELFSTGLIVFSDSSKDKLAILTEFEQQENFNILAANLLTLNCCAFAAELINKLTNEFDPNPELFDGFLQFLKNCRQNNVQTDTLALLILFQLFLLKHIGLQPVLKNCVNCRNILNHNRPASFFSSTANGLLCNECHPDLPDKRSLSSAAADCLVNFKRLADTAKEALDEIEKILTAHFTFILGREPIMAKYILKKTTPPEKK